MEAKKIDATKVLKWILYVIALLGGLLHIYNSALAPFLPFRCAPFTLRWSA